jgi:hypothetical protein
VTRDFLEARAPLWRSMLGRLQDKVEVSVKVRYREDPLLSRILADEPRLKAAHQRLRGVDEAAAHFERVAFGQELAQAVERYIAPIGSLFLDELVKVSTEIDSREPQDPYVALDASCLVERSRLDEFDRHVESLAQSQGDDVDVELVGPLPPYSFVRSLNDEMEAV